jgi:hypothetical protein
MKVLAREFTSRMTGGGAPVPKRGLMSSRAVVALVGLAVAAYAMALVLPNFEACYFSCSTLAGYEWVFGTTFGSAWIVVALVLGHASYWVAAALLLGGARRRWAAIAILPYIAFCGWLGWLVLAYPDFFNLKIGWWLWPAAGALLVTALLVARRPNVGLPGSGSTAKQAR